MNKRIVSILAMIAIVISVANSLMWVRQSVGAARLSAPSIPQRISYQGRLTDLDGNPLDGTYNMTFRLWDHPTAGALCWTEPQDVRVNYGVFNVLLGDITPIPLDCFSGSDLYLGVEVGSDGEMTPRRRVVSVGYAYRAEESSTATYASSAGNADTAGYASSAGTADYASSAGNADTVDGEHAGDFAAIDHVHTNIQGFFWGSGDFAYIKAGVNCGNTPRTANQLCQEAGFSSAVYAKGYYHWECAGPSMLSCEGVECFPAATNCVERSNNIGEIREGDGSTVFDVGGCGGGNPGWFIRLQCRP